MPREVFSMRRLVLSLTAAALVIGMVAGPVSARSAPSPTIVDIAVGNDDFETLVAAVLAADPAVVKTLSAKGQRTVFAPTDDAFAAIGLNPDNVGDLDQATLTSILLYHVAPGARDAEDVVSSSRIRTLNGAFLRVSLSGGNAYVNDAQIVATDIYASNGIIHVIDAVLLPS
jgi:uncharacterized surface protein with fasciclin (FAS1) repeats